jgi:hypothetical protein
MQGAVDAIYTVGADRQQPRTVYGLGGQRYDAPRQGVNIIDGRKTLLR